MRDREFMSTEPAMDGEMSNLFKTHVEFAFGPFRTQGKFSDIEYISETSPLYEMGFRKLQTIRASRIGNVKAILLYNEHESNDAVVCIPDEFPSWRFRTLMDKLVIIIDKMTIRDTNCGLITQNVPKHLACFSPANAPASYSLHYPVFEIALSKQTEERYQCECGRFSGKVFRGHACPMCDSTVDRRIVPPTSGTIASLVGCYMRKDSNKPGSLLQTFDPPIAEVIDQDTPWHETIELCTTDETRNVFVDNSYRIKCDIKKGSYECVFKESGVLKGGGGFNIDLADCIYAMDVWRGSSIDPTAMWNSFGSILNIIGRDFLQARDIQAHYQKLDSSLIPGINYDYDEKPGDYCIKLMLNKPSVLKSDGNVVDNVVVKLQSRIAIVSTQIKPDPDSFNALAKSLYDSLGNKTRVYLITNYMVQSTGIIRSWSRAKCKVVWTIIPRFITTKEGCPDIIDYAACGYLIRDKDNAQLAKTIILFAADKLERINIKEGICVDKTNWWNFNLALLAAEAKEKKDPAGYLQNFKRMAEAMGVSASRLKIENGHISQ